MNNEKKSQNLNSFDSQVNNSNITNNTTTERKTIEELMKVTSSPKVEREIKVIKENKLFSILLVIFGVSFFSILLVTIFAKDKMFNLSGNEVYYEDKNISQNNQYQTVVVTDNLYTGVSIKNENDAKNLIVKDSNNQKKKCQNTKTKEVEQEIEKKYDIVATNLCEMDYDFAKELEKVINTIYSEFPSIKGYLTNLTLINAPDSSNYIASFVAAKLFAKSNTKSTYPNVYKMSIYLNSSYFLNPTYLEYSIEDCLTYGYFPKNATKYSIVAHEFGHYISFLASLKNSKLNNLLLLTQENYNEYFRLIEDSNNGVFSQKIINEAYENYKKNYPNNSNTVISFRNSISEYAVVKNNNGEYIYDETIAEAFHDYYLNKNNAKSSSKEIMKMLKKYLNN